jgi:hypothetical protein
VRLLFSNSNWQFINNVGLEIPFICGSTCPTEHVEQRGNFVAAHKTTMMPRLDSILLRLETYNGEDTLYDPDGDIPSQYYDLLAEINALQSANTIESSAKQYAKNLLDVKHGSATNEMKGQINTLANRCVFNYGPAVWMARAYMIQDSSQLINKEWEANCTTQPRKAIRDRNDEEDFVTYDYKIHPTLIGSELRGNITLQEGIDYWQSEQLNLINEMLRHYLYLEQDSAAFQLIAQSPFAEHKKMMALYYLHDTAMLHTLLDTLAIIQGPIYEGEHAYFIDALNMIKTISNDTSSYYNISSNQLELSMQMAQEPYGHAVVMRNIISDVRGDVYEYPFEYPVAMQLRQMQPDSTATTLLDSVLNNSFKLYPNPNNGMFELSYNIDSSEPIQFEIYDLLGKPCGIWQLEPGNKVVSLQTELCGNGYYLYRLNIHQQNSISGRIIIMK